MVRISASGRVPGLYWCTPCDTWAYASRHEGKKVVRHMKNTASTTNRKSLTVYPCPVAAVFHVGRTSA